MPNQPHTRLLGLDPFDLNYALFAPEMQRLSLIARRARQGIGTRIAAFCWHLLRNHRYALARRPYRLPAGTPAPHVLFFAVTRTELNSLYTVKEATPNAVLAVSRQLYGLPDTLSFPIALAYRLAVPFLPWALYHWSQSQGYQREAFRQYFDHYWLTYGHYLATRLWLQQVRPRLVVVSNDHTMPHRVLVRVAHELGIPTVYMQHAAAVDNGPPLHCSYAFLEGEDALEKYALHGPSSTRVFLIGMPKADQHARAHNTRTQVQTVGIGCTNADPDERIEELCALLAHQMPNQRVVLRPHPSNIRFAHRERFWRDMSQRYGMRFSHSLQEGPFEFLHQVDAVIAGTSSLLLEAAMLNVAPIFYDFAQKGRDLYGFVARGLVERLSHPAEVLTTLAALQQHKPDVRAATRPYCATMGTPYEGWSTALAKHLLTTIATGHPIALEHWQRVANPALEAYIPVGAPTHLVEEDRSPHCPLA